MLLVLERTNCLFGPQEIGTEYSKTGNKRIMVKFFHSGKRWDSACQGFILFYGEGFEISVYDCLTILIFFLHVWECKNGIAMVNGHWRSDESSWWSIAQLQCLVSLYQTQKPNTKRLYASRHLRQEMDKQDNVAPLLNGIFGTTFFTEGQRMIGVFKGLFTPIISGSTEQI